MQQRHMTKERVEVPLFGFGCMRFPVRDDGTIDKDHAQRMVRKALSSGVNYFDTAYLYHDGASETFLGEALEGVPRASYLLADKLPIWLVKKQEDVSRLLEEQLARTKTSYFDFYLVHGLTGADWDRMKECGVPEALEREKKAGRIRALGFSFHDKYESFEYIVRDYPWDFCQIQLNYMDVEHQAGLKGLALARSLGVDVVVMEPIKGGNLAAVPDDIGAILREQDPNETPAGWALRYVAGLDGVKVILSGVSSMQQLEENLATLSDPAPLNDAELAALDRARELFLTRTNNGCTGCKYCMPCPSGVSIPAVFQLWNEYGRYDNPGAVRHEYFGWMEPGERAEACVACGACEERCPQQLHIIDDLQAVAKEFAALA